MGSLLVELAVGIYIHVSFQGSNSVYFSMCDISYLGSSLILTSIVGSSWFQSENICCLNMACFHKFQGSEKENKENRKTKPPGHTPTNHTPLHLSQTAFLLNREFRIPVM